MSEYIIDGMFPVNGNIKTITGAAEIQDNEFKAAFNSYGGNNNYIENPQIRPIKGQINYEDGKQSIQFGDDIVLEKTGSPDVLEGTYTGSWLNRIGERIEISLNLVEQN